MNRTLSHRRTLASVALLTAASICTYTQCFASPISNEAPADPELAPKPKRFMLPKSQYPPSYPGVYAWGSNANGVVAPGYESLVSVIKTPYRIAYFDGKLLRDLVMTENLGVAVLDNGDIVQWGSGYFGSDSKTSTSTDLTKKPEINPATEPQVTLKGKNIKKVAVSDSKAVYGLNASGTKVYAWPVSKSQLESGPKPLVERSFLKPWRLVWRTRDNISYTTVHIPSLKFGEYIRDVQAGNDHILILTSKGRVFSGSSGVSSEHTPKESRGQYGLARYSQFESPPEPGTVHEIKTFKNKVVEQIACGDYHSLTRTQTGDVYVFGDNSLGQLGLPYSYKNAISAVPTLLPIHKLFPRKIFPIVSDIAAGGSTSFVTIRPKLNKAEFYREFPGEEEEKMKLLVDKEVLDGIARNVFAFGEGLKGQLGNGNFVHAQSSPASVKYFSQLKEYSEDLGKMIPIEVTKWSIAKSHIAASLGGLGSLDPGKDTTARDVIIWGGNDHWQIGTGKRNSIPTPQRIPALDSVAPKKQIEAPLARDETAEKAPVEYIDSVDSYNNRLQLLHNQQVQFTDPRGIKYKTTVSQDIVAGGYSTAVYTKRV